MQVYNSPKGNKKTWATLIKNHEEVDFFHKNKSKKFHKSARQAAKKDIAEELE